MLALCASDQFQECERCRIRSLSPNDYRDSCLLALALSVSMPRIGVLLQQVYIHAPGMARDRKIGRMTNFGMPKFDRLNTKKPRSRSNLIPLPA